MALSFPTKKILVVDDNPVALKVLSLALRPKFYEVFTAIDGPEAFAIVRQEKLDLILLDIFYSTDGFESGNTWDAFLIIHWIKRTNPQARRIPIIVISGADPAEFKDRCLAAGAVGYLRKPINRTVLLDAVEKVFRPRVDDVPLGLVGLSNSDRLHR
jgi:two-component system cell cycle response regulator DivK